MNTSEGIFGKLRKLWLPYLLQSALAAAVLAILFAILGEDRMVLITAIGASAFIVFAMPATASAQPKVVIGSHLAGLFIGTVFSMTALSHSIACPFATGIAMFVMVTLDIEHPPAAGTAIAAVTTTSVPGIWITVVLCTVTLAAVRHLLKGYLRNLV